MLAGPGSVPTMAMPLRNISHAQVWVRVPNAPSGDKYEMEGVLVLRVVWKSGDGLGAEL